MNEYPIKDRAFTVLVAGHWVKVKVLGECYLTRKCYRTYYGRGDDDKLYAIDGDYALRLSFDDFVTVDAYEAITNAVVPKPISTRTHKDGE